MVEEVQIVWFGDGSHGGVVYARGLASPSESNAAQLIALSDGTPADKMLDLGFVAPMVVNPTETMTPVEAVFVFKASAGEVVGARVRAARNVLETTGADVRSPDPQPPDVMDLTRRLAMRAPDGSVTIEGLSPEQIGAARIVKVNDPIPQSDVDPNRLTVFVGRDNRVLYVRWN
jgi:enoyl-CoA hydratase/carnithine racemase